MNKTKTIQQLTNILAVALRHKIGAIVNPNNYYTKKYEKDARDLLVVVQNVSLRRHWNNQDKGKIREELKKKLREELERCLFLDNKKFELVDKEIDDALKELGLS